MPSLYLFIPLATGLPRDIKQEQLNAWAGKVLFNPQKLDHIDVESEAMRDTVVKCLQYIATV